MNTTALAQGLTSLHHVLTQVRPAPGAALPELSGTQLRDLRTSLLDTFAALRETLSDTTDPRLALELATTAQQLGFEATRMDLVAAERALNALLEILLDATGEDPPGTAFGDGGPGQGSLFDSDPANADDGSAGKAGWAEDGDECSAGDPD
ncbi:hypothetical protein C1H84_17270, partial [Glutamicibacter soli]